DHLQPLSRGRRRDKWTYPLLRQLNADVVALDVVSDEVGFAVMVHLNDFDACLAPCERETRPRAHLLGHPLGRKSTSKKASVLNFSLNQVDHCCRELV